jgi:hypothetical protein
MKSPKSPKSQVNAESLFSKIIQGDNKGVDIEDQNKLLHIGRYLSNYGVNLMKHDKMVFIDKRTSLLLKVSCPPENAKIVKISREPKKLKDLDTLVSKLYIVRTSPPTSSIEKALDYPELSSPFTSSTSTSSLFDELFSSSSSLFAAPFPQFAPSPVEAPAPSVSIPVSVPSQSLDLFAAPSLDLFAAPFAPSLDLFAAPFAPSLDLFAAPFAPSLDLFAAPFAAPFAASLDLFEAPFSPSLDLFAAPFAAPFAPSLDLFAAPFAPSLDLFAAPFAPSLDLFAAPMFQTQSIPLVFDVSSEMSLNELLSF